MRIWWPWVAIIIVTIAMSARRPEADPPMTAQERAELRSTLADLRERITSMQISCIGFNSEGSNP